MNKVTLEKKTTPSVYKAGDVIRGKFTGNLYLYTDQGTLVNLRTGQVYPDHDINSFELVASDVNIIIQQ